MTYRYDLFISYAYADNQPVLAGEPGWITAFHNQLARLHRENGRPGDTIFYFDRHEIKSGQDWELNIKAGLRDSCLMLAFVSPSYFASEWCRKEWEFYTLHETARAVGREGIHPVYFVEVPQLEKPDPPASPPIAQWLADLRLRQHIDFRPWFPEGLAAFQRAEVRQQLAELEARIASLRDHIAGPVESPGARGWHNEHFIGRRDEMRQLDHLLTSSSFGVLTAVHGLPGIGKTAVAGEYAHAHASRYAGGRWLLPCEGETAMAELLLQLATPLSIDFTEAESKSAALGMQRILRELEARTKAAVTEQRPHPACLLILDNVDKPELLAVSETAPIPKVPWLHVLVTTRLGPGEMPQIPGSHFLAINELPEEDALRLIETLQPGGKFATEAEKDAALWIVRALEYYTLEVEAVAVFLGTYPELVKCQDFRLRLEAEGLTAPQDVTGDAGVGMQMMHREKRLSAVFGPMLEALTEEERFVLDCAALLPPDLIPLPWLRALAEEQFPALKQDRPGHPEAWPLIARRVLGRRLLTAEKQDVGKERMARMHRSVQETLRTRDGYGGGLIASDLKARILRHAKERVQFLTEGWIQNQNRWEIAPLAALAEAMLTAGDDREILDGAWLASELDTLYWRLGNYASASTLGQKALTEMMRLLGEEHPETLASMRNRAGTLWSQGQLSEPRRLLERVLEVDTRVRGEDHPDTLSSMTALASVLLTQGDHKSARLLQERALEASTRVLGEEHPQTLINISNLAMTLQAQGDYAEARRHQQRALAAMTRVRGEEHPVTVTLMGNLALTLHAQGDYAGAQRLQEQVLEVSASVLGGEHPATLRATGNLALTLQAQGDYTGAQRLQEQVLELSARVLGGKHPDTLKSMGNLAGTLGAQGDHAGARRHQEQVLELSARVLGGEHPETLRSLGNLALTLGAQGDHAGARRLQEQALEVSARVLGGEHPHTLTSMNNLALTLGAQGDDAGARRLQEQVLELSTRVLGADHPDTLKSMGNLAETYRAQRDRTRAGQLNERVLKARTRVLGEEHPDTLATLCSMAATTAEQGNYAEARRHQERGLELSTRALGEEHPTTLMFASNLSLTLRELGDIVGARRLGERTLEVRTRVLGAEHPDTLTSEKNLADMPAAQNAAG